MCKSTKPLLLQAALATVSLALAGTAGAQVVREADRQRRLDELQQYQLENRVRANEEVPVGQRALIDWGGYITLNYLSIDDRQRNNHGLFQTDFVLYGRLNLDAANEVFARVRESNLAFHAGDKFTDTYGAWTEVILERAYYRFDLAKYEGAYKGKQIPYNVVFQAGRDLIYWGNGLTMGIVVDGGTVDLSWRNLSLQFIAGVTPMHSVDFDTSRPNFEDNTRRGFYGALATANVGKHHPFFYFLSQRDYNSDDFLQTGSVSTKFAYNSFYIGAGSTGNLTDHLLYGAEFVYEGGHTLANSFQQNVFPLTQQTQTRDQIQALAADLRLDYLFNDPHNARLGAEVTLATGDHDRGNANDTFNGNQPGTRDLGFNGFGLINTGLAFAPEVSNLGMFRLGGSIYPFSDSSVFRRMQVGTDVFLYNKRSRNAAFNERTTNKPFLGWEPDLYMNWQITSDVTLAVRYGIFFPSDTLIQHDAPRQFVYTGLTFAF